MSSTDRRYRTQAWRDVRAMVLARDGYRCQMRLDGCQGAAPLRGGHANHKISPIDGGAFFDPRNLEAACAHCNSLDANRKKRHRNRPTPPPSRQWFAAS